MAEEDDRPEEEDEGDERGARAKEVAQSPAKGFAEGTGYGVNGGRRRREREERARQQGRDGPELILPAGLDAP